jgi:hypothetical protein
VKKNRKQYSRPSEIILLLYLCIKEVELGKTNILEITGTS